MLPLNYRNQTRKVEPCCDRPNWDRWAGWDGRGSPDPRREGFAPRLLFFLKDPRPLSPAGAAAAADGAPRGAQPGGRRLRGHRGAPWRPPAGAASRWLRGVRGESGLPEPPPSLGGRGFASEPSQRWSQPVSHSCRGRGGLGAPPAPGTPLAAWGLCSEGCGRVSASGDHGAKCKSLLLSDDAFNEYWSCSNLICTLTSPLIFRASFPVLVFFFFFLGSHSCAAFAS